ncbi:MAG: dihydrofolate reductase [Rubripirellula sp.]|nr:dihydrofolate reductase [Rubripirellula sp.]
MSDIVVAALVAMTPDGVIGHEGGMPWRLSSDLRRFKKMTMGGVLVMGRRTFDSIGRPLPGRQTVVVTRQKDWQFEGVHRAADPEQAIQLGRSLGGEGIFVVGGAEIYRQLLPHCDWIGVTTVWASLEGDTTLELDLKGFSPIERSRFPASIKDDYPTEFVRYQRNPGQKGR